jgi:phosphatidylinositol glycan class M
MVLRRGGGGRRQAAEPEQQEQEPEEQPSPPTSQRVSAGTAVARATARVARWARLPPDAARLLLTAAAVRVALIAWGELQDRLSPDVKYTDTDYGVFTDAARSVWRGDGGGGDGAMAGRGLLRGTPFARATYRYSPLLAYAVLPNLLLGVFGKVLFSAADLVAGVQCYRLASAAMAGSGGRAASTTASAAAAGWWAAAAWLFNPFTATVSTRGSCDSIAVVMLLGVLQLLRALGPVAGATTATRTSGGGGSSGVAAFLAGVLRDLPASFRAIAPAALLYGLAVHFRIYPIIYAPSTVLFLARRRACAAGAAARAAAPSAAPTPPSSQQKQKRGGGTRSPAARGTAAAQPPLPLRSFLHGLLTDGAAFGVVSAGAFFALGLAFFALYGHQFLHEAFLHHLGRLDPRHNFSAYFYPIYLRHFGGLVEGGAGGAAAAAAAAGAAATTAAAIIDPARWAGLPQVAVLLSVAAALHAHLPLAWLISTVAFVALNKVSTAQYFVWYFCLLPAALPHLLRWRSGGGGGHGGEEAGGGGGGAGEEVRGTAAGTSSNNGSSRKKRGGGGGKEGANGAAAEAAAAGTSGPSSAAAPTPSVPRPLLLAAVAWALLQLHWLAWGYAVEFAGRGAFLGLWGASVAFLAANALLAAALVRCYRPPSAGGHSFVALSLVDEK